MVREARAEDVLLMTAKDERQSALPFHDVLLQTMHYSFRIMNYSGDKILMGLIAKTAASGILKPYSPSKSVRENTL
jgi:hypothetical protein